MTALILVDLQNDFMPGGKLAVKGGDEVLPIIQKAMQMPFDKIVATRDWHPPRHGSFASTHYKSVGEIVNLDGTPQILWPEHCIQGSYGAEFCKGWDSSRVEAVFSKGVDLNVDSYSAFFDNEHRRSTGLASYLVENGIGTVCIAGLATDYCVKYSALDACALHFRTYVIVDGCKGVNLSLKDSEKAFEAMRLAGANLCKLSNLKAGGIYD